MPNTVLHEILAVEQGTATNAKYLTTELLKKFSTKQTLFAGQIKEHQIFSEDEQHLKQATDYLEVQSTVDAQLAYVGNELANYWTVFFQKEETNQQAKADIIVDGVVLYEAVPATALLGMETKLTQLMALYSAIPTLDAAKAWEEAPAIGEGIFQTKHAQERIQQRSEDEYVTVAPATDRHPAQVIKQTKDVAVGKYTVSSLSGAIPSVDKAERIQRLTALIRAVKQARQRANQAEVDTSVEFGSRLLDFINNG